MTCLTLLRFAARLGTCGAMIFVCAGLLACDQSTSPNPNSGSDRLAAPGPVSEPTALDEPPTAAPRPLPDDRPRIVAFGDSLTAGLGVSPEQSYPAQLQKELDALGYRYQVVNAGVSGDTSAGGLRRVSWVLTGHPRLVILELGGNDGLRGLSLSETRSHLDAIIRRFKAAGVSILLAGMKLPPNYGDDYTIRFEAMYRELAAIHALPLIPFFLEGVGGDQRLNQADGIHPTGDGYRLVVANVLKSLLPILDEEKKPGATGERKKA